MSMGPNKHGQATREAIYLAIRKYKDEHNGKSPTVRELVAITGTSIGVVVNALRKLAAQGVIICNYGEHRGIELVGEFVDYQAPEPVDIR